MLQRDKNQTQQNSIIRQIKSHNSETGQVNETEGKEPQEQAKGSKAHTFWCSIRILNRNL